MLSPWGGILHLVFWMFFSDFSLPVFFGDDQIGFLFKNMGGKCFSQCGILIDSGQPYVDVVCLAYGRQSLNVVTICKHVGWMNDNKCSMNPDAMRRLNIFRSSIKDYSKVLS